MGRSSRIFFVARLLLSRVTLVRRLSQIAPRLEFVKRQVAPAFPAALALSLFFTEKRHETMSEEEPVSQNDEGTLKEAEELYTARYTKGCNEVEAVNKLYKFLLEYKDCNNAELLWRLVRATRDLAQLSTTDANSKKSLTCEAHEVAKRGLEVDDANFACHKWFAITLSDLGDYEGLKQKISNAYIIRDHFKKAIDLNASDPTCYHLLGRWCFTIADVSWYQKKIAAVIFNTPPESSFEEAVEYFEKAESVKPAFYSMNQLWLGRTLLRLGKKAEARRWLEQLSTYESTSEEDVNAIHEAKLLLKTC